MVNQIILNYLRTYYKKYPLEDLKKKILDSGYKKEELDEALRVLGLEKEETKIQPEPQIKPKVPSQKEVEKKEEETKESVKKEGVEELVKKEIPHYSPLHGFKWFKVGGIAGIILFIIGWVFSALLILLKEAPLTFFLKPFGFVILVISFILFFLIFFIFFFAFFRVGELLNIKSLKRSSLLIILTPVIIFMISFLILFLIWNQISYLFGNIFVNELGFPLMPLTGMAVNNNILTNFAENLKDFRLASLGIGMAIVYCMVWLAVLIFNFLFGIGLTKIKEIGIAKFIGFFHLVAYSIFSLSIIVSLVLILIGKFNIIINNPKTIVGVIFGGFAMICFATLLEAILLFKISNKFENKEMTDTKINS